MDAQTVDKLVALQETLKEIYELEKLNQQLPKNVNRLRREFEPKMQELEIVKEQIEKDKELNRQKELVLKELSDKKADIDARIKQIQTQKEFNALSNEKQFLLDQIDETENEMLTLQERIENTEKEIGELDSSYDEENVKIKSEEEKVKEKLEKNNSRIEILKKERENLIPGIDQRILKKFEQILQNKDGIGIVPIVNSSCQGCHMMVPPQVVNEVRKGNTLITCLNCSRILYVESNGS